MDNKIDINFINKEIKKEKELNDVTSRLESIEISNYRSDQNCSLLYNEFNTQQDNILDNYKNTVDNVSNLFKKCIIDSDNIDRSSYEYRKKLKRKLIETDIYPLLDEYMKYKESN
jgi:hypothetical protein